MTGFDAPQLMAAPISGVWMLVAIKDEITVEWHLELIGAIAAKFAVQHAAEATLPAWTTIGADASSLTANPFGL